MSELRCEAAATITLSLNQLINQAARSNRRSRGNNSQIRVENNNQKSKRTSAGMNWKQRAHMDCTKERKT